ncbi:MAG: Fic family protein, partial [Tissierellia bacterium]|nr:Fic family protein [Tissierellia bacterium]
MQYNTEDAVKYHYGVFPPKEIDYSFFIGELLSATDVLARYDQMLKNM